MCLSTCAGVSPGWRRHWWGLPGGLGSHQNHIHPSGARWVCRSFRRHLDQCEHQIGPQEIKFQLLNSAQEPLFHCNCTRR